MALDVIGAGWGRTGTLSTKLALERLGLGPCYHMHEVFFAHPEHRHVWTAAAHRAPVDWDALFAGYRSAVDWPTCAFWPELCAAYPEAKVLLTAREPESWYDSYASTISGGIPAEAPGGDGHDAMLHAVLVERSFGGRAGPREHLVDRYRRHVDAVTSTVPADRLLVWSVTDGWAPLCRFLGAPVPDEPFPRVNDRADFGRIFGAGGQAAEKD